MKAVLAYSGGLDTSICVKILEEEYGYDVITVSVDVGISEGELLEAEGKAKDLGATHFTVDARSEFVTEYLHRAIKTNASYEGYPLSTALARPLIAEKVVDIAHKEGAKALVHGATGKGNDQFRFEAVFRSLAPDMRIIAPIREKNLTRDKSLEYAKKHNIPISAKKPYSIDENLWGRSIEGGVLEDPSASPPEDIFQWTKQTKPDPETIDIEFKAGVPVEINGKNPGPVEIIKMINGIAGSHGVGRIDMIEDRILGIKARENYECPAAVVLLQAHKDLEQLVLTRGELRFKEVVESVWSELIYKGLWNEPLRSDLDAFIDRTQERISGSVKIRLHKGSSQIISRKSDFAIYSKEAVSFDDTSVDQRDVEGMLKYHSYQAMMYRKTVDK